MANRRAMKLFAVTILAGTSTAQAGVAARGQVAEADRINLTAIHPRQLANGRPAAGNCDGKCAEPKYTFTEPARALLQASNEYQHANQPIVINPRLLGNARPACGNTGGKVDAPADCTAAEIRAVQAHDKAYAEAAAKREAKVSVAYSKLMAATEAAIRADPSLKARLYLNGRPACGNTMSKKGPPAFCRADEDGK